MMLVMALLVQAHASPIHRVSFYTAEHARSACGPTMRKSWQQIALSRDLMRRLGCGARVRVTLRIPKGGVISFIAIANDVANRRFRTTVDILVHSRRDAVRYGVTSGDLRLLQSGK